MMPTIALEFVPTRKEGGFTAAVEEAGRVKALVEEYGLVDRINTLLVPEMIPEGGLRPVPLHERIDSLETTQALAQEFPTSLIVTQMTELVSLDLIKERVNKFKKRGVERVLFVGTPQSPGKRHPAGPSPAEAISAFQSTIPSRGVILIPTRLDEEERFRGKLASGANFALTQMIYTDEVVRFLRVLSKHPHRPEVILSFGYVPRLELKTGLIKWLITNGNTAALEDSRQVEKLSSLSFKEKKAYFVELCKRVADGAQPLGFPLGVQFACPYGVSRPALETFCAILDAPSSTTEG